MLTVSGNDIGGELRTVLHGVALMPKAVGSSKAAAAALEPKTQFTFRNCCYLSSRARRLLKMRSDSAPGQRKANHDASATRAPLTATMIMMMMTGPGYLLLVLLESTCRPQ